MKLYEENPRGLPTGLHPPARSPGHNEKNYLEAESGRVGPGEAKQAAGPGQAKQAAWIGDCIRTGLGAKVASDLEKQDWPRIASIRNLQF